MRTAAGRITGFTTHMTGEAYGALRGHTILGRTMRDGPANGAPFDAGVRRSAHSGGLLHHIFGVRAEVLAERLGGQAPPDLVEAIRRRRRDRRGRRVRRLWWAIPSAAAAALVVKIGEVAKPPGSIWLKSATTTSPTAVS